MQRWGQPELESRRVGFNMKANASDALELYAFGLYSHSDGVSDFNWRNPDTTTGAYRTTVIFPGWNLRSIYPVGFSPQYGNVQNDLQLVGGLRGEITPKLRWDVSASYGRNAIDYSLKNSINASLGPASPTDFDLGRLTQTEKNANADVNYEWDVAALTRPINVAFGGEFRQRPTRCAPVTRRHTRWGRARLQAWRPIQWCARFLGQPGRAVEPAQQGCLRGHGSAARRALEHRCGQPLRGLLQLRQHAGRQALGALRDHAGCSPARHRVHRLPCADAGAAQHHQHHPGVGYAHAADLHQRPPVAERSAGAAARCQAVEAGRITHRLAGPDRRTDLGLSGSVDVYQIKLTDRFSQSASFAIPAGTPNPLG